MPTLARVSPMKSRLRMLNSIAFVESSWRRVRCVSELSTGRGGVLACFKISRAEGIIEMVESVSMTSESFTKLCVAPSLGTDEEFVFPRWDI